MTYGINRQEHKMNHREAFDVAVIGGGPAGCALATFLQRQGHRCLVLESDTFPRYHIGESLIPHTYGTLDRLGLLDAVRKSAYPVKHSVRFVSPRGNSADPFYFSETIEGDGARTWQVERSSFDTLCAEHAQANGVDLRMRAPVEHVHFEGERAVGVRVRPAEGDAYDVDAKVVVDASGRRALIGDQLDIKDPVPGLVKGSLWSYYRGGERLPGIDAGETTIYLLEGGGWFWYIPLPDDIISVGWVDDPPRLFQSDLTPEATFEAEIATCSGLAQRLANAVRSDRVRGLPEMAYRNRRMAGDGWVMIGDAAAFLDPIYSSGLYLALGSAELAAASIHTALQADDPSAARLGAHLEALGGGVAVIEKLIRAFYTPGFSFRLFVERHPEHRTALIDCLVGDVIGKDMQAFTDSLDGMLGGAAEK
jgi:flavin-dependent dehydrogenase